MPLGLPEWSPYTHMSCVVFSSVAEKETLAAAASFSWAWFWCPVPCAREKPGN